MKNLSKYLVFLMTVCIGCSASSPEPQEPNTPQPTRAALAENQEDEDNLEPAEPYDPAQALADPSRATLTAPAKFTVKLETTKGDIIVDVVREWAPYGADRFYNLVRAGYYNDTAFFRVIGGFMAQVGIAGDPQLNTAWRAARIPDDKVLQSNRPGYLTFAASDSPNSRTTQFFINFRHNQQLDGQRFAPFAKVRDMEVVNQLYAGYGEGAPQGGGPAQGRVQAEGNSYLRAEFPKLDYIVKAVVLEGSES